MIKIKIVPNKYGQASVPGDNFFRTVYRTKAEIISSISKNWCLTSHGKSLRYVLTDKDANTVRLYNLEKHRRVVKVVPARKPTKDEIRKFNLSKEKAKTKCITREVVSGTYWTANVYDIPIDVIPFMGNVKITQMSDHFKIEKVK